MHICSNMGAEQSTQHHSRRNIPHHFTLKGARKLHQITEQCHPWADPFIVPNAVHVARLPLALKSPSPTATDGQPYSTRPTIYALLHLARSVTAPSRRVDLIQCPILADTGHCVKSLALSSVPRPVKQTLRLRLAPSTSTLLGVPVGNMPWRRSPVLVARAGSVSAHQPSISPVRLAEGHQPLTGVLSSWCSRRNNMALDT